MTVRLMLADDHRMLREGLRRSLSEDGFDVVGEASDGEEAVRLAGDLRPDVILMDVTMPDVDGVEATRRILRQRPTAKVLVLTTFNREDYLLAALRAGASAFLLKPARPEQLADAIRAVAAGDALLSPEVTRAVIEHAVTRGELPPDITGPTRPAPAARS